MRAENHTPIASGIFATDEGNEEEMKKWNKYIKTKKEEVVGST